MEKRPFISVVMPIYNVQSHLKKAIDSVLDQTFHDYEIILVDDCSPDHCPEICDEYARKYEKISVIHHKENQGLSAARNSGLEIACGRYIWFMDSDDYVDEELFQKVYDSIQHNDAQIVVFGLVEEYFDQEDQLHHVKRICPKEMCLTTASEIQDIIIDLEMQTLYGYAWNKFYSLDYLKKIGLKYEKITLIEDIQFNVLYCAQIDKMNILAITPYHYNKRMDSSLTNKFVKDYYELHKKRINMIFQQYCDWGKCTDEIKEKLAVLYTRYIFSAIQRNCDKNAKMNLRQRKVWIERLFEEELYHELIPYGKSESAVLKVMLKALKWENTIFCLALGRVIFILKNNLPMLFSKVKQNR